MSKADAKLVGRDAVRFEMGTNHAGYLRVVLLRAYRDGWAEVNHVHIEAVLGDKLYDLTVMLELLRGPTPGEDAMGSLQVTAPRG